MRPAFDREKACRLIDAHAGRPGPLLPVLQALMAEFGCIGDEAAALTAERLNLSRAEVHGAVTFYHDFRRAPSGRRLLKLCRAEACQARGGRAAQARIEAALGIAVGETSADGATSLEAAYCLGLCASGPAALLDGEPMARLTGERLERLIEAARS